MKKLIMSTLMSLSGFCFAGASYVPIQVDIGSKPNCSVPSLIPFGTHQITPSYLDFVSDNVVFTSMVNITCDTFTPMTITMVSPGIDVMFPGTQTYTDVFDLYVAGGAIEGVKAVNEIPTPIGNAIRNADSAIGVQNTATFQFLLKAKNLNTVKSIFNANTGSFSINSLAKTVNFTF